MAFKVTYFDLTALGEPLRFLCSYGNLDWEDIRVEYMKPGQPSQQWLDLKPKTPYGQIPILEHQGKVAHQSVAISRFLAKKVKLVGKDDWEDLMIDSTVDTINDFRGKIGKYHYESDPAIKESLKPQLEEVIPFYMKKLDEAAKLNGGYLAINRLTWADLFFISLLEYLNGMAQMDLLADYPNLQKVKENVLGVPSIKAWIEKRPKTFI